MITIEVGGIDIIREKGSLYIRKAIEERATADFTIVDEPGTATYVKGQMVEIVSDLGTLFNGFIQTVAFCQGIYLILTHIPALLAQAGDFRLNIRARR